MADSVICAICREPSAAHNVQHFTQCATCGLDFHITCLLVNQTSLAIRNDGTALTLHSNKEHQSSLLACGSPGHNIRSSIVFSLRRTDPKSPHSRRLPSRLLKRGNLFVVAMAAFCISLLVNVRLEWLLFDSSLTIPTLLTLIIIWIRRDPHDDDHTFIMKSYWAILGLFAMTLVPLFLIGIPHRLYIHRRFCGPYENANIFDCWLPASIVYAAVMSFGVYTSTRVLDTIQTRLVGARLLTGRLLGQGALFVDMAWLVTSVVVMQHDAIMFMFYDAYYTFVLTFCLNVSVVVVLVMHTVALVLLRLTDVEHVVHVRYSDPNATPAPHDYEIDVKVNIARSQVEAL